MNYPQPRAAATALAQPERINPMPFKLFQKRTDRRIIRALQDIARENFVNPFDELARVKLLAKQLLKTLQEEKNAKKS